MRRWQQGVLFAVAIVVGLAIGTAFARREHAPRTTETTTTTTSTTALAQSTSPPKRATSRRVAVATPIPIPPTVTPIPQTAAPVPQTAAPVPQTPAPLPPTAAPVAPPAAGGVRLIESGTSVGTIVWSGNAAGSGGKLALDLVKERVAGNAVGPCERATHLRANIDATASDQTVPYTETNCAGSTSSGEMRTSRSGEGLTGSFWSGGTKLGDFVAQIGR